MATWMLFERSLLFVTRSLEQNRKLVTKVYFPAPDPSAVGSRAGSGLSGHAADRDGRSRSCSTTASDGVWYITLRPGLLVVRRGGRAEPGVHGCRGAVDVGAAGALPRRPLGLRYVMPFWIPADAGHLSAVTHDSEPVSLARRPQPDGADRRSVQVGHARSATAITSRRVTSPHWSPGRSMLVVDHDGAPACGSSIARKLRR